MTGTAQVDWDPSRYLAFEQPRLRPALELLIGETVRDGPWALRLQDRYRPFPEFEMVSCHRWLREHAAALDIWETEYLHALDGEDPVFHWTRSTALLATLALLSPDEAEAFSEQYRKELRRHYPAEADGHTLFPFRRLFIVAQAPWTRLC